MKQLKKKITNYVKGKIKKITIYDLILIITAIVLLFNPLSNRNQPNTTEVSAGSEMLKPNDEMLNNEQESVLNNNDIATIDNIDKCIKYATRYDDNKDSLFKDSAQIFYEVGSEYNINPIFLLINTAYRVGWKYSENDVNKYTKLTPLRYFKEEIVTEIAKELHGYISKGCKTVDDLVANGYGNENWKELITSSMDDFNKIINN